MKSWQSIPKASAFPLISHESYNKLYHLSTIKQPP